MLKLLFLYSILFNNNLFFFNEEFIIFISMTLFFFFLSWNSRKNIALNLFFFIESIYMYFFFLFCINKKLIELTLKSVKFLLTIRINSLTFKFFYIFINSLFFYGFIYKNIKNVNIFYIFVYKTIKKIINTYNNVKEKRMKRIINNKLGLLFFLNNNNKISFDFYVS